MFHEEYSRLIYCVGTKVFFNFCRLATEKKNCQLTQVCDANTVNDARADLWMCFFRFVLNNELLFVEFTVGFRIKWLI